MDSQTVRLGREVCTTDRRASECPLSLSLSFFLCVYMQCCTSLQPPGRQEHLAATYIQSFVRDWLQRRREYHEQQAQQVQAQARWVGKGL